MYTSRRHDLRSEASARFERGVDPNLSPDANARACRLLVEIAGGEVLTDVVDVVANVVSPASITLPIREAERVLGDRYTVASAAAALERLELAVETDGDQLDVTVPTNRPDLTRPADLI
jgi:phenylalanyl-tRNA synthetase beta chain